MKKIAIGFVLCFALLISCSKDENAVSNSIVGTWVFKSQVTNSYAYPSVLTNPFPISSYSWSTTSGSVKISFDNNGNYEFLNFSLPADRGKYVIAQDSFLIIKPDTAGFVKFNYSLSTVVFSPGPLPVPPPPYQDFVFSTDTILMKRSTGDSITFSGLWLTKAKSPIIPSNDTLILNQSYNNFKRQ